MAVALSLAASQVWALDFVVTSVAALAVVEYCFSRVEAPSWFLGRKKPDLASRVYRYSIIEKHVKPGSESYLLDKDSIPLLNMPELRSLPKEDLMDLDARLKAAR